MTGGEETRKVFDGFGTATVVFFYVLATLTVLVFLWGAWLRVRKYRRGRPALRLRVIWHNLLHPLRIRGGRDTVAVGRLAANGTVARRNPLIGVAHFAVFWGFIALFLGTVILTIDTDIVRHATKLFGGEERSFFKGAFYLGYSFVLDTLGLAALIGLAYLAVRRSRRPARLDYTRAEQPEGGYSRKPLVQGDWLFLVLFAGILVTGFLIEGVRIVEYRFPTFEVWSPVGWILARVFQGLGLTAAAASTVHIWLWWVHAFLALGFVAYIPYSKAMHIVLDVINVLATDKSSTRSLPAQAEADHVGYRQLSDFTWKELLDLDACTKCGRCHEVCPARTAGAPLSPRDLILDLRQWADTQSGGVTLLDRERRGTATGPLAGADAVVAGDVVKASTLWSCTTCMACVEACPVGIEHVPTIVEMRRTLVDAGTMDPTLQQTLQNLASQGNSFGKSARQRARWTKGLDVEVKDARKEPVTYLWFVGDYASFDERLQANTRLLATVLSEAGVDFGILYEAERNSGNDVRRVGEEGLFEMLAEANIEALASAQFQEVFTTDPHTLNALRNEYPALGASYPVLHYTELLVRLIEAGDLRVNPLERKVTYHDPCYLGRYNGVVDAPRRLLELLGCTLVEMPRNRTNSFCCGAGGGRIWMDDSMLSERPSENRIREAATLDVGSFVVSCPKDMTMFSDAAKTTGHDGSLTVVDIVGLVDEALARDQVPA